MLSVSRGCSNNLLLIWTDYLSFYCELATGKINILAVFTDTAVLFFIWTEYDPDLWNYRTGSESNTRAVITTFKTALYWLMRGVSPRIMATLQLSSKHKCSPSGVHANDHRVILAPWPSPWPPSPPVECLWGIVEWHLQHFPCHCAKKKIKKKYKNPDDHSRVFVSGAIIIDLQRCERRGAKQDRK